jgi:hypothetical protein
VTASFAYNGGYKPSRRLTCSSLLLSTYSIAAVKAARTCMLDTTGLGLVDFSGPDIDFLRKDPDRAKAKLKAIEMARRTTTQFWNA